MDDLGQYANCHGCGEPFSAHEGFGYGYEIALVKFSAESLESHEGSLHDNYFCGECASAALSAVLRRRNKAPDGLAG